MRKSVTALALAALPREVYSAAPRGLARLQPRFEFAAQKYREQGGTRMSQALADSGLKGLELGLTEGKLRDIEAYARGGVRFGEEDGVVIILEEVAQRARGITSKEVRDLIKANRSGRIGAGNLDEYWRRAERLKGSVLIPPRSLVEFGQVAESLDKRHEKSVGARAHEMARALLASGGQQATDPSAVMTVSHIPEDAD